MNQAELNRREIAEAVQRQWEDDMYELYVDERLTRGDDDDDDDDDKNISLLEEQLRESKEQLDAIKCSVLYPYDECPLPHMINLRAQIDRRDCVIRETEQTMVELRNEIEKIRLKLNQ